MSEQTENNITRVDAEEAQNLGIMGSAEELQGAVEANTHYQQLIANSFNLLAQECHDSAVEAGWWQDLDTGESLFGKRNKGEMLMLMVTELAEAYEGVRKDAMDDHLPHRKMEEVELADVIIRLADYAGAHQLDVGGAIAEKLAYNAERADHKPENRRKPGGKKT
jgi:NTP pyrophosphatase (non-canonical NTP hydrolase)